MHNNLKEGGKDETARGVSLRELQRFFKEHDMNKGYAGLRRIPDEDGTAVWTKLKDPEVAAQLKKRAGERREEDGGSGTTTPKLEVTDGDVPDMAAELREDMKAIKAQLSQLDDVKAIKEELGELKAKQQGVNDELFNLRKGFFWIQSPMRTTPP